MKRILGIVALALISASTIGQNALDKHFSQYQENDDFTKVRVSAKMFDLAELLETDDEEIKELQDFASGIESLNMLIGHEIGGAFEKYARAIGKVDSDYEELMSVDDKEGKFTFYIDENNGIVEEFVVVGGADSTLVLISLVGELDLKKLGNISQKIQTDGFDYIGKMNTNGANDIKVYPNPAAKGGTVTIDIPEELNGADLNVYSANGKLVKSEKALGRTIMLDLDGMKSGQFIIEFAKGDTSIKKKLFVN